MSDLKKNISQVISDLDEIEKAIEECGVEVPYGTNTKEYGDLVREACKNGGVIKTVDETQFAIDENKNLTLLDIEMSKVTGLLDALDGKANADTISVVSDEEFLMWLVAAQLIEPASSVNGEIYTSKNNEVYVL